MAEECNHAVVGYCDDPCESFHCETCYLGFAWDELDGVKECPKCLQMLCPKCGQTDLEPGMLDSVTKRLRLAVTRELRKLPNEWKDRLAADFGVPWEILTFTGDIEEPLEGPVAVVSGLRRDPEKPDG